MTEKETRERVKETNPGEFVDEDAVTMTQGSNESEFDNGVSASFIRFNDMDEDGKRSDEREG